MMVDLARVKRNVTKMAGMGAPESDIDEYIAGEGTTIDAVRDFRASGSNLSAQQMQFIEQGKANAAAGVHPDTLSPEAAAIPSGQGAQYGGIGMNATAGANSGLYGTLGAPVDLMRGAMNLGIRGVNAVAGSDIGQIPEDSFGGSRFIGQAMGAIDPALDPANTVASTTGERVARGLGEGAGYALAPEAALAALSRAGAVAPKAGEMAARVLGRSETLGQAGANAAVGAAGGAGASAAMEVAPDNMKPLAGMAGGLLGGGAGVAALAVPSVARAGAQVVGDLAAPLTAGGRQRLASETLQAAASDPGALRRGLEADATDLVPGSKPTTFQLTGDMGIGALERGAAARNPEAFNQRRADQNSAQVSAIGGIQAEGAPEKVASVIRDRLKSIDEDAESIVSRATSDARKAGARLGLGTTPDQVGATVRGAIEQARAAAKDQEQKLWLAVDPDGTLALPATNARQFVSTKVKSLPASAKPPAAEEAEIYNVLSQYGDVSSFQEVQALQSRVKTEMRRERAEAGETPAYGRLAELNSALFRDLESAAVQKVEQQSQAVARGEMRAEDTVEAAMNRQVEAWFADRAQAGTSGGNGATGFSSGGPSRPFAPARVSGTAGQAGRGSAGAQSDPRLSGDGLRANFDDASLGRLEAARDATSYRANTFDNKTLGPLRRRPSTAAAYDVSDSQVPGRIFYPQAKSYDAIQTYRKAVGDGKAFKVLQDYAVDRLRKVALNDDGTFDAAKLARWTDAHSDALRAFPELRSRLASTEKASETMAAVGRIRQAALQEAQRGQLGKFLGLEDPTDVVRTVGGIFSRQDATAQMMKLRKAIGVDKEAQQGLRKAIVDHMTSKYVGNTEAATSGIGTVKSDGFQNFVRQNASALRSAGFSADELELMGRVAADLQRANRSIAAVKLPGGSNTTQDLLQVSKGDGGPTLLSKLALGLAAGGGAVVGGGFTAALGAVGAQTLGNLRKAGIESVNDLVADALLDPKKARLLLAHPPRKTQDATWKMLGAMYRRSAAASAGVSLTGERDQTGDDSLQVTIATGRR